MKYKLNNTVSVITGSSRGIGAKIAEKLYESGSNIVINYKQNLSGAEKLKFYLEQKYTSSIKLKIIICQADITDENQAKKLITSTYLEFSRLDILVNNAGIAPKISKIENLEYKDWQEVIDTNLTGVFNVTKAAIPLIKNQKSGRIINISSLTGVIGDSGIGPYTAAKGGLITLTKTLAKELAKNNITVNTVVPGYIDEGIFLNVPQEIKEKILPQIPLRRFGNGYDIANLVLFLASQEANYITGQTIHVNGGVYM
ncbi:MAG: 3-oxoacyl-ACP reductase family protein [Candidatus Woesearchaeota archaeon]